MTLHRLLAIPCTLIAITMHVAAQHPAPSLKPRSEATMVGVGTVRQQDTYLSPLTYRGTQLTLLHESLRPCTLKGRELRSQHLWQADASLTDNAPDRTSYLGMLLRYDYALLLPLRPWPWLRVWAGPQAGASIGGLYSTRNGNNPAQALADVHMGATLAATAGFTLWRQSMAVRAQADWQLLGLMFSPEYGQSYYEVFALGNKGHNLCWRTPLSVPTTRSLVTLDWHLRTTTLRVGALFDLRQSHVNHLRHHAATAAVMVGCVHHFYRLQPQRHQPQGFDL